MVAADAADDLAKELEDALLGREIRKDEAAIGLDDADKCEAREIEALGYALGTDNNIELAVFDFLVLGRHGFGGGGVAVKAGDAGGGEEPGEFGGDCFGADALMDDVGGMTLRAGGEDGPGTAAGVAEKRPAVEVQGEGEEAAIAKGLPTARAAKGGAGRAAAIVEDEGLLAVI